MTRSKRRSRSGWGRAAWCCALAWISLLPSCVIEGVDLSDKACPCDRGWICDSSVLRCVRDDANEGGGGAIRVHGLRGEYPTSNEILWTWGVEGAPDDFDHYLLVTGASLAAVIDGEVTVWSANERLPLGRYETLPGEQMVSTTHPPDTAVFAQVIAIDRSGVAFASNVASATTRPEALEEVVVLDDELDHVISPDWLAAANDAPARGTTAFCLDVYCDGDGNLVPEDPGPGHAEECGRNLQIGVPPASLDGVPGDGAFLEVAVRVGGGTHDLRNGRIYFYLRRDVCERQCGIDWMHTDCQQCYWRREPIALTADGTFHPVQVALLRFANEADNDNRLAASDLGAPMTQFALGATWEHGTRVCLDAVRVRY